MFANPSCTTILSSLKRGQVAVIEGIEAGHGDLMHLASLGLSVGATLEMLMPGSPCAVAVGGTRLVLRHEEVKTIQVSLL